MHLNSIRLHRARVSPLALLAVAFLTCASTGFAQLAALKQISQADGRVTDTEYGLAFTCPSGWTVVSANRWGDMDSTLFVTSKSLPNVQIAVETHVYYEPFAPAEGHPAWLIAEADRRARFRGTVAAPDYTNRTDSFVAREIGGHSALTWSADYTTAGRAYRELLALVVSESNHVYYFAKIPADNAAALEPAFEALVASTRLTPGTWKQSLPPEIFEARRAATAKDFAKAVDAFTVAFEAGPARPVDLVIAAAAAAQADRTEVALAWLGQAVAKGFNQPMRLTKNPAFTPLHATEEWKKIVAALERTQGRAENVTDPDLQKKLLAILDEDQKYRMQTAEVEKKFGRNSPELRALMKTMTEKDAENLPQITHILDEKGWVGPDVIGAKANSALFLVIQHSDLATQKKYLPMMREAAKNGAARPASLALLEDRIALRDGHPQIYGSQITRRGDGPFYVDNLGDPEHVDERRASVGLGPLADYVAHWDIKWDAATYIHEQAERGAQRR
ncbi:MAG: hypothetical protein JWM88_2014 [Verrucomicrobia bacterium]|nr:hypothetical protein [Verrucomicrobiota bacterium]